MVDKLINYEYSVRYDDSLRRPLRRGAGKGWDKMLIFQSVKKALQAGFIIESAVPDREGFLHARIQTRAGWAGALVRVGPEQ